MSSDAVEDDEDGQDESDEMQMQDPEGHDKRSAAFLASQGGNIAKTSIQLDEDERVLTTGILAKDANFKLVVSGRIGPKEIERLIQKLQLDKEILADPDGE